MEVSIQRNDLVAKIAVDWALGSVLVVGPLDAGKLTALRKAASILANDTAPALEFATSPYTTLEDLVGHYVPSTNAGENGVLRFRPGLLAEAMSEGRRLIVADADQLSGDARIAVLAALRGQPLPPLPAGQVTTIIRPGFALAATASRADFELTDAFTHVIDAS